MSESTPETSVSTQDEADDSLAFEREWADARRAAGLDSGAGAKRSAQPPDEPLAEISPMTLLYTGFLLGPAATFLVTLFVLGRQMHVRAVAFALGVTGAAWCTIQAATFGLAGDWTVVELQMLRTGANFTAGLLLLVYLRRYTDAAFGHDRQTVINTVVLGVLLVLGYVFLPDTALVWIGR